MVAALTVFLMRKCTGVASRTNKMALITRWPCKAGRVTLYLVSSHGRVLSIDIFGDTAAVLIFSCSNSYYGMRRRRILINLKPRHLIIAIWNKRIQNGRRIAEKVHSICHQQGGNNKQTNGQVHYKVNKQIASFVGLQKQSGKVRIAWVSSTLVTGGPSSQSEELIFLLFMQTFSTRNVTYLPRHLLLHNHRVGLRETCPSPCSIKVVLCYNGLNSVIQVCMGKNGNSHYSWNLDILAIKMTYLNALLSFLLSCHFSARSEAF